MQPDARRNGHVFVARGSLEVIDADAVVVPTDAYFHVEQKWNGLWRHGAMPTKPPSWGLGSAMPSDRSVSDRPAIWFMDVAVHAGEEFDEVINKILVGIATVLLGCKVMTPIHGRTRPLIAIPTLGVGGGGLNEMRGEVIRRLLDCCAEKADQFGIDVVIVAYGLADYSAFQYLRRISVAELGPALPDHLDVEARRLATQAKSGELALFVGAGVSQSAGLPSWDRLIGNLLKYIEVLEPDNHLGLLDLAELISREDTYFRQHIAEEVEKKTRPGLAHLLLASLGCAEVVTTNFDLLYERAVNYSESAMSVLPWETMSDRGPWLLKMHGDTDHPKSIVLSRSDFADFGTTSGPAGAAMQSLMLSRHLLIVGASLTDDNFLRLAHEVTSFLDANKAPVHSFGTVLSLGPEPARARLYKGKFEYVNTNPGIIDGDGARASAIFLDTLGMYASEDAGFLLDPRYRTLVAASSEAAVLALQNIIPTIRSAVEQDFDGPIAKLWKTLQDFGAT